MQGSLFSAAFSGPLGVAYRLVLVFAHVLSPFAGGLAAAAAIVLFTIAVRLLLSPLSFAALRGQARIARLAPRVQALRQRYASRPDRLQAELAALYRAESGGMLAGCLPLLLQLPFFSVVYRLFLSATVDGKHNDLLAQRLLSAPLGSHWLSGAGPASTQGLVFLGLFVLLAVTGLASARAGKAATTAERTPATGHAAGQPTTVDPVTAAGLSTLTRILPYTTLVIAAFVPLAAGLYLATSAAWTTAERTIWRRRAAQRAR